MDRNMTAFEQQVLARWSKSLEQLINEKLERQYSLSKVANSLGVAPKSIKKYAAKYGITLPKLQQKKNFGKIIKKTNIKEIA